MDEDSFFQECVQQQKLPEDEEGKLVILRRLMKFFPEEAYREVIVNEILGEYFEDIMRIREELERHGFLEHLPARFEYRIRKRA